jgi:hypothetical protein
MLKRRAAPVIAGSSGEEIRVGGRLGWLYLEQGHLTDAATVFEAVLRTDPDDESARRGLEETRRRSEDASDGGTAATTGPLPESPRRRRIVALERYLTRILRHTAANR